MAAWILLTLVFFLVPDVYVALEACSPVYRLETAATITVGVTWLVRGPALLEDEP